MCFVSSAERTSCAHSGQYDCQKHVTFQFHKNYAEQASASGNVRAFFASKEKLAKDDMKQRVMVANVKMCEMIAELNLSLATADSLTNILIGSLKISIIIMALLCKHVMLCRTHSFCCLDIVLKLEGCTHK